MISATQTAPDLWPLFRDYMCSAYAPARQDAQLDWFGELEAHRERDYIKLDYVEVALSGHSKTFGAYRMRRDAPDAEGEILLSHNSKIVAYPFPDNASFQSVGMWVNDPGEMDDRLKEIIDDSVYCIQQEKNNVSNDNPTPGYTQRRTHLGSLITIDNAASGITPRGSLEIGIQAAKCEYTSRRLRILESALADPDLPRSKTNELILSPAVKKTYQLRIAVNDPEVNVFHLDAIADKHLRELVTARDSIWCKSFIGAEKGKGTLFSVGGQGKTAVVCAPYAMASFCSVRTTCLNPHATINSMQSFLRENIKISGDNTIKHGAWHKPSSDPNGRMVTIFDSCAARVVPDTPNPMQLRPADPRYVR